MIMQSPLKKRATRPNLRKVPKPEQKSYTSAQKAKKTVDDTVKSIKPWKVILALLAIGIFGFMYLTHVFSTQVLLEEVQALETEYNKIRTQHDALKLQYDRMIGPAEIYDKAAKAGFINGGPADKIIVINK